MLQSSSKVLYRFTKIGNLGKKCFRCEKLRDDHYENFIDFTMNYFVKHEITHTIAGIYRNPAAMEEYREIIRKNFKDPSCEITFYYEDNDDNNEIVAYSGMKLYSKGDTYKDTEQANTKEVKLFYKILHEWNKLCPVPDILEKYGADLFYDDLGTATNPIYKGYGFANQTCSIRRKLCCDNGVPLTGAWATSMGTRVATERLGWKPIYEITSQELGKKLGVQFGDFPPTYRYMLLKI